MARPMFGAVSSFLLPWDSTLLTTESSWITAPSLVFQPKRLVTDDRDHDSAAGVAHAGRLRTMGGTGAICSTPGIRREVLTHRKSHAGLKAESSWLAAARGAPGSGVGA